MREGDERVIEQPRTRGTNDDEYQIYCENARALGWYVKTYDEWLNSCPWYTGSGCKSKTRNYSRKSAINGGKR